MYKFKPVSHNWGTNSNGYHTINENGLVFKSCNPDEGPKDCTLLTEEEALEFYNSKENEYKSLLIKYGYGIEEALKNKERYALAFSGWGQRNLSEFGFIQKSEIDQWLRRGAILVEGDSVVEVPDSPIYSTIGEEYWKSDTNQTLRPRVAKDLLWRTFWDDHKYLMVYPDNTDLDAKTFYDDYDNIMTVFEYSHYEPKFSDLEYPSIQNRYTYPTEEEIKYYRYGENPSLL